MARFNKARVEKYKEGRKGLHKIPDPLPEGSQIFMVEDKEGKKDYWSDREYGGKLIGGMSSSLFSVGVLLRWPTCWN